MEIVPDLAALLQQQTQHQQQILTLLRQQIRLTSLLFTKVHHLERLFVELLAAEDEAVDAEESPDDYR